jgi:tyrosyl-DNA phosphodiesterase 2
VFPEDETLVRDNGLVDAWVELHPREPGFTWGIDCTQPFPPNRLDKVAIVGLKVQDIEIKHPDYISVTGTTGGRLCGVSTPIEALQIHEREHSTDELVPWSDHSGLRGSFRLDGLYY